MQWEGFEGMFPVNHYISHKPLPLMGSLEGKTLPVWPDSLDYHEMEAATESMAHKMMGKELCFSAQREVVWTQGRE